MQCTIETYFPTEENLGFISQLNDAFKEQIQPYILEHFGIVVDPTANKEAEIQRIVIFVKNTIGFDTMVANGLSDADIAKISKIKTGLCGLKKDTIDMISRHAEVLTELHVKVYCVRLV